MAVNLDVLLQSPIFDFWAVPVTFMPNGGTAFSGRGILNTYAVDVQALDGSIFTDQRTILDIRESEFATLPKQNDQVDISVDCNNAPKGTYQIIDATSNGGGQTVLTIRKLVTAGSVSLA
jgi:hypothetical protein